MTGLQNIFPPRSQGLDFCQLILEIFGEVMWSDVDYINRQHGSTALRLSNPLALMS